MEKYEEFESLVKSGAEKFRKELGKSKVARIISHLDADGLCAASILIKALMRENIRYSVSILPQLKEENLKELSEEEYPLYIFTDLGSGQILSIKKYLGEKRIFVIDHHTPNDCEDCGGITHINPHLCGIKGDIEISGAGVVFLFSMSLNPKNKDMAHIAVVGAIGDVQEKNGFSRLNSMILDIATHENKISRKKSLRLFGAETKPLYKMLAYSTDIIIPEVTGSESRAIQFLSEIGISPQIDGKWKKLSNLTEKELETLISAIIMKRKNEENPDDILGYTYTLIGEEEGSPTRDSKEFSTMLNACGRLNKASIGIGACLGDKKSKQEAAKTLLEYKKELLNAINWYNTNKNSESIIKEKGFVIINAKDNIMGTMIGTLASMISHSDDFPEKTFIVGIAKSGDGTSKVSLRVSGKSKEGIDLKSVVDEIVKICGGESGGHSVAAGASIPEALEGDFINAAKKVLGKKVLEEVVR